MFVWLSMSILLIPIPCSLSGAINHFTTEWFLRVQKLHEIICKKFRVCVSSWGDGPLLLLDGQSDPWSLPWNCKNSYIPVELLDLFRIILQRYSAASFLQSWWVLGKHPEFPCDRDFGNLTIIYDLLNKKETPETRVTNSYVIRGQAGSISLWVRSGVTLYKF